MYQRQLDRYVDITGKMINTSWCYRRVYNGFLMARFFWQLHGHRMKEGKKELLKTWQDMFSYYCLYFLCQSGQAIFPFIYCLCFTTLKAILSFSILIYVDNEHYMKQIILALSQHTLKIVYDLGIMWEWLLF